MNQNQKFKVKEFEWFEMQTRVRQMVQQMISPMQKRIMQHSTNLTKIKDSQSTDSQKVTELTMMVTNDPNIFEMGIFKQVDKRFQVHEKAFEEVRRLIEESNSFVDKKFDLLDMRMKQTNELMISFASLKERVNKEVEMQNDNIQKVRNNLEKMIEKVSQQISHTNDKIVQNFMACQKTSKTLEERIRVNETNIDISKDAIENNKRLIKEKNIQLQTHEFRMQKILQRIQDLQNGISIGHKIQQYIKDMQIAIRKCQFRVQAVTPLVTMAQLQQALQYILPEKLRKKIIIFGYKKYNKLNREILDKNYDEVKEKFNGMDLVEAMQKKNMREITSLKRKKIISMGIDIDHLTFEARQRYYQQVDMDQLSQQQQDNQNNAKIDQAQILNLVSLYFNEFTTDVSQKVKTQLQDTKAYLYGMQSQLKKQMEMNCQKVKKSEEHCVTFHRDQMLELKVMQSKLEEVEQGRKEVGGWLARGQEVERKFYNFCSLINHLQIQQQIDKQNISLMGLQQNRTPLQKGSLHTNPNSNNTTLGVPHHKPSVVQIQTKCFSCCGYPASVLSSFKMACLAYHPSNIVIDGKEYRREDVLEFTTNLLQTIKGNLQSDGNSNGNNQEMGGANVDQDVEEEGVGSENERRIDGSRGGKSGVQQSVSHQFRTMHQQHRRHPTNQLSSFQTLQKLNNSRLTYLSPSKPHQQATTINELPSKLTNDTFQPQGQLRMKSTSMRLRKSLRKSPAITDDKSRHKKSQNNSNGSSSLSKDMIAVTNNFLDLKRRHLSYLT